MDRAVDIFKLINSYATSLGYSNDDIQNLFSSLGKEGKESPYGSLNDMQNTTAYKSTVDNAANSIDYFMGNRLKTFNPNNSGTSNLLASQMKNIKLDNIWNILEDKTN